MIPLTLSRHARERWAERFPGLAPDDLAAALHRAERVTYEKLLRWAGASGNGTHWRPDQEYAHDGVTGAMFVIAHDPGRRTVVTVIPFKKPAKTRRTKGNAKSGRR